MKLLRLEYDAVEITCIQIKVAKLFFFTYNFTESVNVEK
jgi:hypothetical protein